MGWQRRCLLLITALIALGPQRAVASPLSLHGLVPSLASPQAGGTPVTWTAVSSGGVQPVEYQFWVREPNGTWSMRRDWLPTPTWTWAPITPGTYRIHVRARNAGSAGYEASLTSGQYVRTPDPNEPQVTWARFKAALGAMDKATALSLISQESNLDLFIDAWTAQNAAQVDAWFPSSPPLRLVEVTAKGNVAIYEAQRVTAGVLESYEVQFIRGDDGIWRLLSM